MPPYTSERASIVSIQSLESRRMLSGSTAPIVSLTYAQGGQQLQVTVNDSNPVQLEIMPLVPANATQNGTVGFGDILAVSQHYGQLGNGWAQGNFTFNPTGSVGLDDLLLLAQHYGQSQSMLGIFASDNAGNTFFDYLPENLSNLIVSAAPTGNDTLVDFSNTPDTLAGGGGLDSFWANSGDVVTNVSAAETALNAVHLVSLASTPVSGDPSIAGSGATYQSFAGDPLFSSAGPQVSDVVQGNLGDCYFMASLASIAKADANQILQDIVELPDDTFLVRFMSGSTATYLHLDAMLPATNNQPIYAALGQNNSLWSAMLEKAFAIYRNGADSYANIGAGGWMNEPLADLGLPSQTIYVSPLQTPADLLSLIQGDLAAGDAVTVGVLTVPDGIPLIPDHAYSVDSIETDANGNLIGITLRNPWGTVGIPGYAANDGLITLTGQQAVDGIYGIVAAEFSNT